MGLKKRVAIIGGGVSGLAVALECLSEDIASVDIFESASSLGGMIQTVSESGYVLETAAQGVLMRHAEFARLATSGDLICPAAGSHSRFLMASDHFVKLGVVGLFRILGFLGVLRLLAEPFVAKGGHPTETMFDFFRRRFGLKVAQGLLVPMSRGIWAGGAKRLNIAHCLVTLKNLEIKFGSVIRGIFKQKKSPPVSKQLGSFVTGMQAMHALTIGAIQTKCAQFGIVLNIRTNSTVQSLTRNQDGIFGLDGKLSHDLVVIATQPWHCPLKFREGLEHCSTHWSQLNSIPTHNAVVVGLGGKIQGDVPAGFGALSSDNSHGSVLGVLYVHSTYPQHVPPGHFLFRFICGGEKDPNACDLADSELINQCIACGVATGLFIASQLFDFQKVIRWPASIPLATESQNDMLLSVMTMEAQTPGLYFVGNYLDGVGVGDCLRKAAEVGRRIQEFSIEQ